MSTLKPISPRPSPRNSPRNSPRPALRPSPRSTHSSSLPGTPRSSSKLPLPSSIGRATTPNTRAAEFTKLLEIERPVHREAQVVKEDLKRLRRLILADGIPTKVDPSLRPRIWKILLQIPKIDGEAYLELIRRGPCGSALKEKIRNDTFRTLATDRAFKERVPEEKLVRLLDAFVWKSKDSAQQGKLGFAYVQGMNVLAAPFLYIMPSEVEAFYAFSTFIEQCCPTYVQPALDGAHNGVKLLDKCLEVLDPELFNHLQSKGLHALLYAFPSVLTLCAGTPPLDQVLQLWDFLLAYGVHLNVLCIIAQLFLIRGDLMSSQSPNTLLRKFPPLDAQQVIAMTVTLVRDIPLSLYQDLVRHPWDISLSIE
ncbi:hypothetical protein FRC18_008413 [Serendipita sp. 400]|nr:hypothetical protein FRC18_008413 [Serendipita sp. 400]